MTQFRRRRSCCQKLPRSTQDSPIPSSASCAKLEATSPDRLETGCQCKPVSCIQKTELGSNIQKRHTAMKRLLAEFEDSSIGHRARLQRGAMAGVERREGCLPLGTLLQRVKHAVLAHNVRNLASNATDHFYMFPSYWQSLQFTRCNCQVTGNIKCHNCCPSVPEHREAMAALCISSNMFSAWHQLAARKLVLKPTRSSPSAFYRSHMSGFASHRFLFKEIITNLIIESISCQL